MTERYNSDSELLEKAEQLNPVEYAAYIRNKFREFEKRIHFYTPLPENTAVIGKAPDGLPFMLDLNARYKILFIGEPQETDKLLETVLISASGNTRDLSFAIINGKDSEGKVDEKIKKLNGDHRLVLVRDIDQLGNYQDSRIAAGHSQNNLRGLVKLEHPIAYFANMENMTGIGTINPEGADFRNKFQVSGQSFDYVGIQIPFINKVARMIQNNARINIPLNANRQSFLTTSKDGIINFRSY